MVFSEQTAISDPIKILITTIISFAVTVIFTARRYASAVYDVVVCLSV